eukprot:TRINITY_DN16826_c0_g1_i2.p1 TRINITY_DN16826_c0_g1~~TRINITY_DN16826_c0_g1_i2.p1  ORF type:complete len:305 (-),score=54.37 TRINITY_DN16826_c0_g1_i2:313-1227(-)
MSWPHAVVMASTWQAAALEVDSASRRCTATASPDCKPNLWRQSSAVIAATPLKALPKAIVKEAVDIIADKAGARLERALRDPAVRLALQAQGVKGSELLGRGPPATQEATGQHVTQLLAQVLCEADMQKTSRRLADASHFISHREWRDGGCLDADKVCYSDFGQGLQQHDDQRRLRLPERPPSASAFTPCESYYDGSYGDNRLSRKPCTSQPLTRPQSARESRLRSSQAFAATAHQQELCRDALDARAAETRQRFFDGTRGRIQHQDDQRDLQLMQTKAEHQQQHRQKAKDTFFSSPRRCCTPE